MEVRLARTAGFCMGVRLAMEKVVALAKSSREPLYTCGPLIHNTQALEMLEALGVRNLEDCPEATAGTVVIRAHGVRKEERAALASRGFRLADATCPNVLASQRKCQEFAERGYAVIIAGDKDHAEVAGLKSYAGERAVVVSTPEEASRLAVSGPACLIAQTTFNEQTYREIADTLRARVGDLEVVESICRATHERQEETRRLAAEVEAMVVVGGRHSANTRRLAEIARASGKPTFHVETPDELDREALARFKVVGLTAGASTPNWLTRAVLQALEEIEPPTTALRSTARRLLDFLVRSNLYSAAAAAAATGGACALAGGCEGPKWLFPLAAFAFILTATTVNRLAPGEAAPRCMPPRLAFYRRHQCKLLLASGAATLAAFAALAAYRNYWSLSLLAVAYAFGLAYSLPVIPGPLSQRLGGARLKDLPASKDILIALGWVTVCVFVPLVSGYEGRWWVAAQVAWLVFALAFARAVAMDLRDTQDDYLQGRETLPMLIGPRRARWLMAAVLLSAVATQGWPLARVTWELLRGEISLALNQLIGPFYLPRPWLLSGLPPPAIGLVLAVQEKCLDTETRCVLAWDGLLLLFGAVAFLVAPFR